MNLFWRSGPLYPVNGDTLLRRSSVPTCYFPDGDVADGNFACDLSTNVSSCCGVGSACLDNGICQSNGVNNIRGGCTDPTFSSPGCPGYCLDASAGGTDLISCQNVTSDAQDFCCDHTNNCCDTGVGRFRLSKGTPTRTIRPSDASATLQLPSSSSNPSSPTSTTTSALSSTIALASTTSEALPSISLSPDSSSSTSLSGGAKAGIAVGAVAGALLLLSILFLLWKRARRPKIGHSDGFPPDDWKNSGGQAQHSSSAANELPTESQGWVELSGREEAEMPGERTAWELAAER